MNPVSLYSEVSHSVHKPPKARQPQFSSLRTLEPLIPEIVESAPRTTRRDLIKSGVSLLSLVSLGCLSQRPGHADDLLNHQPPLAAPFPKPDFVIKPRLPSSNITWTPNVKVLASVGGDYYSLRNDVDPGYSYYTKALVNTMRMPNVMGLEAAHTILESSGYYIPTPDSDDSFSPFQPSIKDRMPPFRSGWSLMYPTSTLRRLVSWERGETKNRFAVLLGQRIGEKHAKSGDLKEPFNKSKRNDLDSMEQLLKDIYGLKHDNRKNEDTILRIDAADRRDVQRSLDWLKEKVKPGDEMLVYYTGHGDGQKPDEKALEGDTEGELSGPGVKEKDLKNWVEEKLGTVLRTAGNPAKLLFILSTCHSGSQTAKANGRFNIMSA